MSDIDSLERQILDAIDNAADEAALETVRAVPSQAVKRSKPIGLSIRCLSGAGFSAAPSLLPEPAPVRL